MDPAPPRSRLRRLALPLLVSILVVLGAATVGLVAAAAYWRVRTFSISTASMSPAIQPGDWIVIARGPIERGAVVVHRVPGQERHLPLVKRVVAVAGDTVEVRGGRLVLDGVPVDGDGAGVQVIDEQDPVDHHWFQSPCIAQTERLGAVTYRTCCTPETPCGEDFPPQPVPPGTVFVLGDRRDRSNDSRYFGPVPVEAILGRATWIHFSHGPGGIRWERIGRRVR